MLLSTTIPQETPRNLEALLESVSGDDRMESWMDYVEQAEQSLKAAVVITQQDGRQTADFMVARAHVHALQAVAAAIASLAQAVERQQ